jgi:methionyl-tRNA formyltransferase
MKDLRIVFMGTPDFATHCLKHLIENEYNVVGVITAPDRPSGRGQKVNISSVKKYSLEQRIEVLQPTNLKDSDFINQLKEWKPDVQVVVAFRMLPKEVWQLSLKGTFNLHASLLPKYRGAAPINWAIINGEKESGVTTFFIDEKIDTGNIIFQEKVKIKELENAGSLHDKLMNVGGKLITKTIDAIKQNNAPSIKQEGKNTQAPKIFKQDCRIDWQENPKDILQKILGLSPYPTAWTTLLNDPNKIFKIYDASIETTDHKLNIGEVKLNKTQFKVAVKNGFICLKEVQISGKKRMKIDEFLRGFQNKENCFVK